MARNHQKRWALLLTFVILLPVLVPAPAFSQQTQELSSISSNISQEGEKRPSIVGRFFHLIRDMLSGAGTIGNYWRRLVRIIRDLGLFLKSIFVQIEDQKQSSQCHNRSCTQYGTR